MLIRGEGAVCFEHSALLEHVFKELGFEAGVVGGQIWRSKEIGFVPPGVRAYHASVLVRFPDGSSYQCDAGHPLRSLEPVEVVEGREQWQADGRGFRVSRESDEPGAWTLEQFIQGEWARQHRSWPEFRPLSNFNGAVDIITTPGHPFRGGWVLSICRPDGAHVSVATGGWAGSEVPPGHAKHVVRKQEGEGQGGKGDGPGGRAPVVHTERVIPIDSEELRALAAGELRTTCQVPGSG
ncbi:hypothetical protein HYH03_002800 [Edaphochlamys debaryana]|uniref:Arylamine N-acetyltransferase n=1 Tax=Edaphochlamys debaryana TaxID=47281 RepID=A0A835YIG7_9CHLO|nr:hypothetical protein HYH03_002800 [Edaphochlamys debaryana]|eukprot:KAG2499220.1 hypothetical protein HYH03_002800 [Edaphochlamys debaryana]